MKNPLVSVIIPYFKKKKFIKHTIYSILNQSYKNLELILVYDDENKDDLVYIKRILSRVKNKKIIVNKRNYGVSKSRNIAINFVKGKYTAFIDADDIWHKNKIKKQVEILNRNKKLDLSYTAYYIIDEKSKILGYRQVSQKITYSKLLKECEIGLSTVLIKTKILQKNRFPLLETQEDFGLWLRLLRSKFNFFSIPKKYVKWRKNKNSLSSNNIQKIKDAYRLFYYYENMNFIFSVFCVLVLSFNKFKNSLNQKI